MIRPCDTPAGSVWTSRLGKKAFLVKTPEGHIAFGRMHASTHSILSSILHGSKQSEYYEHTSYIPPEFLT